MELQERDYYLGFSVFSDIGPKRFKLLLEYFGSAQKIWEASEKQFKDINLRPTIAEKFLKFRKNFSIPVFLDSLKKKKTDFLCLLDIIYPKLLKEIADPPIVIYFRGNRNVIEKNKTCVAIVGSRLMTVYGKNATEKITKGLCGNAIIVSGLADGVDTIAHKTAIENKGETIAVLGSGIDVIYPYKNYDLYWKIAKGNGLVLSEYPPGFAPSKSTFPLRNRIISGLSKALVVIEGKKTSGSLITARFAAEQGREVFAIPGPINSPMSEATSYLLKNGASLASNAEDILEEINS